MTMSPQVREAGRERKKNGGRVGGRMWGGNTIVAAGAAPVAVTVIMLSEKVQVHLDLFK